MESEFTVEITTEMVKKLRQMTGAGVLDCKKMLEETSGDLQKAADKLRDKGLAKAAKKVRREAKEGIIGHYVHAGSRVAALVEVNCETDFVARTSVFHEFAHDVAMQVVGAKAKYLSIQDIPPEVIQAEKAAYRRQMEDSGKPGHILDRIAEGKLSKFYQEVCLLEQPFIKDEEKKVSTLLTEMIAQLGENIVIRRFVCYELGEEL